MSAESQPRYLEPNRSARIFNATVGQLTKAGISVYGSRVLAVRGRKSGEWRTTPVNPLTIDGQRYLISPRGNTQWVRNMRAAGGGELRIGRRVEKFTATELPPRIAAPAPRQIAGVTLPSPRSWPPDPAVLPPGKWFR